MIKKTYCKMRKQGADFPDNGFEAWGGYMQAKIAKLEEQFCIRTGNEEQPLSSIFSGVSIFVNGYTNPSADELKYLMVKHGGVYHTYKRSSDFIIASNLPDFKVKKLSLAKVVKPEWITDSIAANCLLDYKNYLLYDTSRTQPKLNFNKLAEFKDTRELKTMHLKADAGSLDITEIPKTMLSNTLPIIESKTTESNGNNIQVLKCNDVSTKTAADPNFITEFYNNSRLHHISQLGACFKQHINDLRENSSFEFPDRIELKNTDGAMENQVSQSFFDGGKTIMHIDMDCFFVSVGLRKRPELRGLPVAVTHSKGGKVQTKRTGVDRNVEFNLYKQKQATKLCKAAGNPDIIDNIETKVDKIGDEGDKYGSMSEIASCSYEARAKGISNGMFMGAALRLCPDLKTIPYDFEGYKEVAYTLYNTVAKYTLDIEAVSCDEMYVDCTELLKSLDVTAQDFATALREEIKLKTGCPCSTGFGGNRLQARLATKHAKPDGQFFLFADLVNDFMFDIKLRDLPGVGRQTSQKLEALGHQTCGSLQCLSSKTLQSHLGTKTGLQLYDQCRGKDPTPLQYFTIRKSVSAEVNYGIRFENNDQCYEFLRQLANEVHNRMVQFKVVGKCITIKLMVRAEDAPIETAKFMGHGFCDVINKSVNLNTLTNDPEVISREVIGLCKKQKIDPKEMRGIGIQITKLETTTSKPIKGAINKYFTDPKSSNSSKLACSTSTVLEATRACVHKIKNEPDVKDKLYIFSPTKKLSPQKKTSPLIGTANSPSKRRGRPSKNLSMKTQSFSKNLIRNFLQGPNTISCYKKESILKSKLYQQDIPKTVTSIVEEPSTSDGLLSMSWKQVRELLKAWLDSGQKPLPCDIVLISSYMREMVINKNIDKVNILINFLRRRTREMGCDDWMKGYDQIVEQVQYAMIAVYGKSLYISD